MRTRCDAANCSLGPQGWSVPQHSACHPPLATRWPAVTGIRADFQNARYDRMAASLPALIAAGTATRDHADSDERATASTLLADAYITATNFMVKLNDDPARVDDSRPGVAGRPGGRRLADAHRGPSSGHDRAEAYRPFSAGP